MFRLFFVHLWVFWTFQKDFVDKYEAFVEMVLKIYGNEPVTPVAEMKQLIAPL